MLCGYATVHVCYDGLRLMFAIQLTTTSSRSTMWQMLFSSFILKYIRYFGRITGRRALLVYFLRFFYLSYISLLFVAFLQKNTRYGGDIHSELRIVLAN
jgi:hypothetical protein